MAEGENSQFIHCEEHSTEVLNLFCFDCKEVICVQCLLHGHQKHELKPLSAANSAIQEQLAFFRQTEENTGTKLEEFKNDILHELSKCETGEIEQCNHITNAAAKAHNYIDEAKDNLQLSMQEKYRVFRENLQRMQNSIEETEQLMVKCELEQESADASQIFVETFVKFQKCLKTKQRFERYMKDAHPVFISNSGLESEKLLGKVIFKKMESGDNETCVTENPATSTMVEAKTHSSLISTASQTNDTTEDEVSSDEARAEDYPVIVELTSDEKEITKLIPISNEDAWIICGNKLMKLIGTKLVATIFTDDVDDISVMQDNSVLALKRESGYIVKRMVEKRILNFLNCDTWVPQCIFTKCDNNSVLFLNERTTPCQERNFLLVSSNGVILQRFGFKFDKDCNLLTMTDIQNDNFILFHNIAYTTPRSKIYKFREGVAGNSFQGVIGVAPSHHFKCHGLCSNGGNKLLVSDKDHHSILLVDLDMQFEKCVLTGDNGLETPTTIAMFNSILWIVDGNKIRKWKN